MKTYTFHVTLPGHGRVWRKIEMRADQTLEDLHYAIQDAYEFDADHLYSFFMSGKAWDSETEYALPEGVDPYGFPMFDEDIGDDDEDEDLEEDAVLDEAPEAGADLSPDEFALAIMRMINEGMSLDEVKGEVYKLTGQTPETMSLADAQALDSMLNLAQTLMTQVSLDDIEAFVESGMGFNEPGDVRVTTIEQLSLKPKQKFMYLFDYGDEWRFDVRVHAINADAPEGDPDEYPRIVEEVGEAPSQYPDWDEEDEDWDDDEDWDEEDEEEDNGA